MVDWLNAIVNKQYKSLSPYFVRHLNDTENKIEKERRKKIRAGRKMIKLKNGKIKGTHADFLSRKPTLNYVYY